MKPGGRGGWGGRSYDPLSHTHTHAHTHTHTTFSQHTKGEEKAVTHAEDEGIPALVFDIHQRVHSIANQQWEQHPAKILESKLGKENGSIPILYKTY